MKLPSGLIAQPATQSVCSERVRHSALVFNIQLVREK